MTYAKQSYIGGFDTMEQNPHEIGTQAREDWFKKHYIHARRAGHWKVESAVRLADKLGIVRGAKLTHDNIDLSGKGRSFRKPEILLFA